MARSRPAEARARGPVLLALALALALVLAPLAGAGCAFSSYGERGGKVSPAVPSFIIVGKTPKADVIAELGEPDEVVALPEAEVVARYRATRSWFILGIGRAVKDELTIRFDKDGKVVAAEARRRGDSIGIGLPALDEP